MVGSRGFTLRVLTRVQIGTITLQNNLPLSSDIESTRAHGASGAFLRCPPWRISCIWRQEGRVIGPGGLVRAKTLETYTRSVLGKHGLAESHSPTPFSLESKPSVGIPYSTRVHLSNPAVGQEAQASEPELLHNSTLSREFIP